MPILLFVSLVLVLLACNIIYCSRGVTADLRQSRRDEAIFGMLALSGAMMAALAMVWVTLASLAHL